MNEIKENKYCSGCKEEKPLDCFGNDNSTKDGLKNWCKPCRNEAQAKYRKTPAGKATQARGQAKYRQSPKGKAAKAKFRTKIPPAVYQILNKKTGEVYIGESKIPATREILHWSRLRNGCHENRNLQQAYNKYGPDTFTFQIIEHPEPNQLRKRERYWIKHFGDICYNVR